jgi:hypothetical protein
MAAGASASSENPLVVLAVSLLLACSPVRVIGAEGEVGVARQALYTWTPPASDCGSCGNCQTSGVFDAIARASAKYGLPRWFYFAIAKRETGFCPRLVNGENVGAPCTTSATCGPTQTCRGGRCSDCGRGLLQLTPNICSNPATQTDCEFDSQCDPWVDFGGTSRERFCIGGRCTAPAILGTRYPYDRTAPDDLFPLWRFDHGLTQSPYQNPLYKTPDWISMQNVTPLTAGDDVPTHDAAFNVDRNLERFTTGYAAPAYYLWRRRKACTATSQCAATSPCYNDECSQGISQTCTAVGCAVTCNTSADCITGRQTCELENGVSVCTDTPEETLRKVAYHYHYGIFQFTDTTVTPPRYGYTNTRGDQQGDYNEYLSYPPEPPVLPCTADAQCQNRSPGPQRCIAGSCRRLGYDDYVNSYKDDVEADDGTWAGSPALPPYLNQPNANQPSIAAVTAVTTRPRLRPGETTDIVARVRVSPDSSSGFNAIVDIRVYDGSHTLVDSKSQPVTGLMAGEVNTDVVLNNWRAPSTASGPFHVEIGVRPEIAAAERYYFYDSEASTPSELCVTDGQTEMVRDVATGEFRASASDCTEAALTAHFLGSRGAFHTALTFENPRLQFPTSSSCALGASCLKYTPDCQQPATVRGLGAPACANPAGGLADPNEINCHCQAPDFKPFPTRLARTDVQPLQPAFQVDTDRDRVVDAPSPYSDLTGSGGDRYRMYPLEPSFWRWELEDMNVPPAGDFNDYVAAFELNDCNRREVFPPYSQNFGTGDTQVHCSDACGNNACTSAQTAASGPLRFTVGLGIDEDLGVDGPNREARGRKLHLTVATHSDELDEELAVCPVMYLAWSDTDPAANPTQRINYLGNSDCFPGGFGGQSATGIHQCPAADREVMTAELPISMSVEQSATRCHGLTSVDEATQLSGNAACGAGTLVRDYELALEDIDRNLTGVRDPYIKRDYARLSGEVQRVELYVFRNVRVRPFVCPSGVNALLRAAPDSVAKVTRYDFRPFITPGFEIYRRQ